MPTLIDYSQELNSAQLEAVTSTEGPHLVIAGAGSGKTRVLVFRTAKLVEQGVDPRQILLLTFTRRAAGEMLDRAAHVLDDRCRDVAGGTFHSFANKVLRRYASRLGWPSHFTIFDESDAQKAVQALRSEHFKSADKKFPKKQTLLSIISKSINKCVDVEDVVYEEFAQHSEWVEDIRRLKQMYADYKRRMTAMDFDDLLVILRELLETQPDVRQDLSKKYRYIMVDEYQDTNPIQAQIVRLLCDQHDNVMVVGDDSQSIYSFRGAHFLNILNFPKEFPGTKVIMLEQNYRSSQPILNLTNEVINRASEKFEKSLFTERKGDSRPVFVDVPSENAQSRYVVRQVRELLSRGVPLGEVAVLFRSGWHSNDLEVELTANGIPFVKYGGQRFVEAAHVKDVMCFLRVLLNPDDEISWQRILNLLPGIGPRSAAKIIDLVRQQGKGAAVDENKLPDKPHVRRLFQHLRQTDLSCQSLVDVVARTIDHYQPLLLENYEDVDKRVNDLSSLQGIASRYDDLQALLTDLALDPPEYGRVNSTIKSERSKLVLSTIHSAKGLEWHTVFILHVAEGYLPSYQSLGSERAVEEERRLFYVATTRAKDHLFMIKPQVGRAPRGADSVYGLVYTRLSRFLEEGMVLRELLDVQRSGQI